MFWNIPGGLWLASLLYINPLLKILLFPLNQVFVQKGRLTARNALFRFLGKIEYFLSVPRDFILSPLLVLAFLLQIGFSGRAIHIAVFLMILLTLSLYSYLESKKIHWETGSLLVGKSDSHPVDFLDRLFLKTSFWPCENFSLRQLSYHSANFRTGKAPKESMLPWFKSCVSSKILADMVIRSFKRDPQLGFDSFDDFFRFWGMINAYFFKAELKTKGYENFPTLSGKSILVYNHKSTTDFVFNSFCIGMLKHESGRQLRPRFIAAKDHFIDNKIVYSWMGVGRAIEQAGMIFVNRQKGKGWQAMQEAAQELVNHDVEIAVYPQGTRADAFIDFRGKRRDAGFYTTYHPKYWNDPLGHLKKGTAHLILDSALALKGSGLKLNIVPVSIDGTANAVSKGTFKCQTEAEITFRLSEVWEYRLPNCDLQAPSGIDAQNEAQKNYLQEIESIHKQLNWVLVKTMQHHKKLIERLKEESIRLKLELEDLLVTLEKEENKQESFAFIILDRLFARQTQHWEENLQEMQKAYFPEQNPTLIMHLLEKVSKTR